MKTNTLVLAEGCIRLIMKKRNVMQRIYLAMTVGIVLSLLQACGGGGGGGGGGGSSVSVPTYSGLTTEARVEDTNAESLSTAAASGVAQSVVASSLLDIAPRSSNTLESELVAISPTIAQWIVGSSNLYAARDVSGDICDAGGSADLDANADETVGTITFSNCGIRVDATSAMYLTGTVDYSITLVGGSPDTLSMNYHVNATYAGQTQALNLSLNCVGLSGASSCSIRSDFAGIDGRVYRVLDISVTPYSTDSYYIDATVYDPDYGHFSMVTTVPLLLNCANGVPSAGAVDISGDGPTSWTITFVSCSEYNVTINGGSKTYYWP
jgi:hypothetical protein